MRTLSQEPPESLVLNNRTDSQLSKNCEPSVVKLRKKHPVFQEISDAHFAAILENVTEAIYVLDVNGNLIFANHSAVTSAGYDSIDVMLKVPFTQIVQNYEMFDREGCPYPADSLPVRKAFLGETPPEVLLRVHHRLDSQERWVKVKTTPIFDVNGEVSFAVVSFHDVTQRVNTEDALRKQVQIIDQLQDAVISTDMDGYILSWNRGAERLFGYSSDEMVGKHIYLLYQEGENSTIDYRLIAPELKKSKYNLEMRLRDKEGTSFFAHLSLSKLLDAHGNAIGMIVYAMDISQKKRVEEELNRQLQEKTLLARLNALIASASDMPDALSKLCSEMAIYLEVPQATGAVFDIENTYMRIISEFNPPETPSAVGMIITIDGNPALQRLIDLKLPLAVTNVLEDPGLASLHELYEMRRVKSTLIVPIIIDKRVIGTLNFESFFPRTFQANEISTIQQVANQIGQVLTRKQAEQELRESESKFRSVVENSPAGIIIADDDYRLVYVNDQICHITGYTAEELLNSDFRDKLDSNSRELLSDNYIRRQRGENIANHYEFTLMRKDGVKRQLEITASVIDTAAGEIRTIGQIVDITEKKVAEKLLRDSEERFRALVQNSSDLVTVIDSGFHFQYISPSVLPILGYEPEELIGKNILEFMHPSDVKHSMDALSRLLTHPNEISVLDHRFKQKDGSWRWFESTGSNQLDNPSIAGIVGNTREITERKQAEEALIKAHKELEIRVQERTRELTQTNLVLQNEIEDRERAERKTRAYLARVESLARVAERLNLHLDLGTVFETLCKETAQALQVEASAVLMYDEASEMLEYAADYGAPHQLRSQYKPIPFSLIRRGLDRRNPMLVIPDIQMWEDMPDRALYERNDLHTVAAVPMYNESKLVGTLLTLTFGKVRQFSKEELSLLQAFANQGAVSIANAHLFEQVHAGRSRLQALSKKLVEVQEAERRHLARELHDEIGQTLTSLKLKLEMISSSWEGKDQQELDNALEVVTHLMRQVRELSLDLRPSMLDDLGLLPALLHLIERYSCQTHVQVRLQHNGINRRFSPTIETTAYRVIQEGLTNAARHAEVDEVAVRIWSMNGMLEIQIQDQGVGFDAKTIAQTKFTGGITGIQERIALAGGKLEIESTPNQGTQLSIELPLQDDWIERRQNDR